MGWTDLAGVVVCGLVSMYFAVRLILSFVPGRTVPIRSGPGERWCDATHATMGAGMAVMFSPHASAVPVAAGVAVFVLLGAGALKPMFSKGLGCRAGMDDAGRGGHGSYFFHLAVGCAAMIFMYFHDHGDVVVSAGDAAIGAHEHSAVAGLAVGWLMFNYFLVVTVTGGFKLGGSNHDGGTVRLPTTSGGVSARAMASSALVHWGEVAMAAGMAGMFLRMF